jgi:hypothetical protein
MLSYKDENVGYGKTERKQRNVVHYRVINSNECLILR